MFSYMAVGSILTVLFLFNLYGNPVNGIILQRIFPEIDFSNNKTQIKVATGIFFGWPVMVLFTLYRVIKTFG